MVTAKLLRFMAFGPSGLKGLWLLYPTLQNLIPSFPWISLPCPPTRRKPRKGSKGRDTIFHLATMSLLHYLLTNLQHSAAILNCVGSQNSIDGARLHLHRPLLSFFWHSNIGIRLFCAFGENTIRGLHFPTYAPSSFNKLSYFILQPYPRVANYLPSFEIRFPP